MSLDRRGFFQVSLWGTTGLVLSFYTGAELYADQAQAALPEPETFKANAWIRIEGEGRIVFTLDRSEMGQGVYPSFALLVAEELEIDPEQLIVEFAPAAREYGNPKIINLQVTGGSTSLTGSYESLRMAGASLREVLRQAAAKRWQVELATCHAEAGAIHHKASARSLSYASLAVDAAKLPLPTHLELKKPKDFRLIGKARLRSDALLKVTGQAQFGIDATIPDLRIAVYLRSPVFGARLKSYQAQEARKVPGVEDIIAVDDGLAIVAQRYWQARKAAELIAIEWDTGTDKKLQSETIFASFTEEAKTQIAANAGKNELGT
ncbi:MAG: molybdopterin-dependent oxidoreductase, partial [Proteobacteria bacterium]|nr:molybdopterin-dependent oxidoreductase [Pseudomonadota bacterium]